MSAHNFIEIKIGSKFDQLTVIRLDTKLKNKQACWICDCKCGTKSISVRSSQLRNGKAKSCGCLRYKRYRWKGYGEISGSYWYMIQSHAKNRNREFNITLEQIWNLFLKQNRKCALTGIELTFTSDYRNSKNKQTASLDRIDSEKGYIIDNVQWLHKDVNELKRNYPQDKFLTWVKLIAEYNK